MSALRESMAESVRKPGEKARQKAGLGGRPRGAGRRSLKE
jgi:hypothetical protein